MYKVAWRDTRCQYRVPVVSTLWVFPYVLYATVCRHSSQKQRLTRFDVENGLHKNSVFVDLLDRLRISLPILRRVIRLPHQMTKITWRGFNKTIYFNLMF